MMVVVMMMKVVVIIMVMVMMMMMMMVIVRYMKHANEQTHTRTYGTWSGEERVRDTHHTHKLTFSSREETFCARFAFSASAAVSCIHTHTHTHTHPRTHNGQV
jgi:hypothetical protein